MLASACPSGERTVVGAQPGTGPDALPAQALVASYVNRAAEQIEWDVPLAGHGLDELDASEVLMVVEDELDLEIRSQDLEMLLGSSAVNGLHPRLTTRALVQLVEMGRAAGKSQGPGG